MNRMMVNCVYPLETLWQILSTHPLNFEWKYEKKNEGNPFRKYLMTREAS